MGFVWWFNSCNRFTLFESMKRLHELKEGLDRLGIHTVWRNYVSKLKKKSGKVGGLVSMLQAPVFFSAVLVIVRARRWIWWKLIPFTNVVVQKKIKIFLFKIFAIFTQDCAFLTCSYMYFTLTHFGVSIENLVSNVFL
jgi:hypothetical protein